MSKTFSELVAHVSRNRWKISLQPAQIELLIALVDNQWINIKKLGPQRVRTYHVQITRLRKVLPKKVKIQNEWGGVYFISPDDKKRLKEYER